MSIVADYIPRTGIWRAPTPIKEADTILSKREDLQIAATGYAEQTTDFGKFQSAYKLQSDLFAANAHKYETPNSHFFEFKVNSTAYGEALHRTMNVKL